MVGSAKKHVNKKAIRQKNDNVYSRLLIDVLWTLIYMRVLKWMKSKEKDVEARHRNGGRLIEADWFFHTAVTSDLSSIGKNIELRFNISSPNINGLSLNVIYYIGSF